LTSNGSVSCWGRNNFGQVGDGTTADVSGPKVVVASGATAVATGDDHSCAIVSGTVRCWGRNQWGQLGLGDNNDRSLPTPVPNLFGATAIALGNLHTCVIYSDANVSSGVKCWGRNTDGELGLGANPPCIQPIACLSPSPVPNFSGVKALSASTFYTCAIDAGNSLKCWGRNEYGELGQGDQVSRNVPTTLPVLSGVSAIATGDGHRVLLR
jgi:alpha-tubulin suppressor-like RCC1 family protein